MALFGVRLTRILPAIIVLAILAIIIYLVVSAVRSPLRAKEVLIKVFTVIFLVILAFFVLAAIYAVLDNNDTVFELSMGFAIVGLIGLAITRLCGYLFRRHHPHYRNKASRARVIHHWPWQRRN